jgi:hypothetical protein
MAISGTGTQNDPYLVSTVAEIASAISAIRAKTDDGTYYMRLTANIDGMWSKFPVIEYNATTTKFFDFDCRGYEIKNFTFEDGVLFGVLGDVIRNCTLYNFYSDDDSEGYIDGIKFVNSSLSCRMGNHVNTTLKNVIMTRCAFWCAIDDYDDSYPVINFIEGPDGPSGDDSCDENDIMLIIENYNTTEGTLISYSGAGSIFLPAQGKDTRVQGHITAITPATITKYPAISGSSISFRNSVINFDMPAYSGMVSSGAATNIVPTDSTGIINSDKILETTYCNYTMAGLIAVTNEEIVDADALTTKGFPVYDITPDE